jgi:hypothetical protein
MRLDSPSRFLSVRPALALALALAASACVARSNPGPRGPGPDARAERREDRRDERRDDRRDNRFDANSPWDKLGERWVDGRGDRDVIHVGKKDGRFQKIQLVVEHSSVELYDIVVTFGDGSTFAPGTRLAFGPNSTTRVIDLPGGARVIRKVELRYGNLPGGGRAQIELWGI